MISGQQDIFSNLVGRIFFFCPKCSAGYIFFSLHFSAGYFFLSSFFCRIFFFSPHFSAGFFSSKNRVHTGHGKPGKSCPEFKNFISRPGKSWNLIVGP